MKQDHRHELEHWENEGGAPAAKGQINGLPNSGPGKKVPVERIETETFKIGPTRPGAHDRFFADLKRRTSRLSAFAAGGYGKPRLGVQAKTMTVPHPAVCRPGTRIAGTIHLSKLAIDG